TAAQALAAISKTPRAAARGCRAFQNEASTTSPAQSAKVAKASVLEKDATFSRGSAGRERPTVGTGRNSSKADARLKEIKPLKSRFDGPFGRVQGDGSLVFFGRASSSVRAAPARVAPEPFESSLRTMR